MASSSVRRGVPYRDEIAPITSGVTNPSVPGYQSLIDANPYTNAEYNPSPWKNFLNALGIRTQGDAWKENMAVQANEYNAAIMQKKYDEEYNLPVNQVARLRAAGLNPDINGGDGIESGSAAPLGEDPSTPMQSTGDEGYIMSFVNGVMSAFSSALGLVNGVQGVVRNRIQNSILTLQAETNFSDAARNYAIQLLPNTPDALFDENGDMVSDWRANALGSAQIFSKNLPKKMQKKFLNEIEQFWNTAPTTKEAYESWSGRVNARKDYFTGSQEFYSEVDEVLREISFPLAKMAEKIYSAEQRSELSGAAADTAESNLRAEIATNVDGLQAAETQNAQNRAAEGLSEIQETLRDTMNQIMKNLEHSSAEGGMKGTLSQFMLIMMCMQQMQMLPSVSDVTGVFK